jgi:hypothetical protein
MTKQTPQTTRPAKSGNGIEGEGSYSGTRAYNEATKAFVDKGKVDKAAQEAKHAVDSPEGADLEKAEARGKAGDPKGMDGDRRK